MKFKLLAAAALIGVTSTAYAGGMSEPVMEPIVIEEESGSSGGFVIPLLLLAIIAAVASSSDSTPTPD
jgi:hypothetical protein